MIITRTTPYADIQQLAARDGVTDALAAVIPAVVGEQPPDGLDVGTLRSALRHFALPPGSRSLPRPPVEASALRWLEKASLPVSEIGKPQHARTVLDAISLRQDGSAASATTIARKRSGQIQPVCATPR